MKKKITQILVLAMVIGTSAFAGKDHNTSNKPALIEFNERFSGAQEVSWSSTSNYVKASFQLNDQFMSAYFTTTGEFISTARNLSSNQLPINLQVGLKKYLAGAWISELFEYSTNEDTTYYATIENGDQKIVIKSENTSSWSVIKKHKKD